MTERSISSHTFLAGLALVAGLAGGVLFGATPVHAQLTVEPQGLSVAVPQFQTTERTVTLTNAGAAPLAFCLSFDRPLQATSEGMRLDDVAVSEEPCGDYGEVLARFDESNLGGGWDPSGLAMTPDGRLFVDEVGGLDRTFEFTRDLDLVRHFPHPVVGELDPFPSTGAVTYDAHHGTLWWRNIENGVEDGDVVTYRVLLLEGDFDGNVTGSRIELRPPEGPVDEFVPTAPSHEQATDLFFFIAQNGGTETRALWAVDRSGTLAPGYPAWLDAYPLALLGGIDAHGGATGGPGGTPGVEGVRVEMALIPQTEINFDRIVVLDRFARYQGAVLETPAPPVLFEDGGSGFGSVLRDRVDPNGALYTTFGSFEDRGVVAVRPHPLPPTWLEVDSDAGAEAAWDGVLAPGESRDLLLTFRAGARAVGDYTASLQAFEAASGVAVEVPLSLTVTAGTDVEGGVEPSVALSLSVYPNPVPSTATVSLELAEALDVQVELYDVLGRRVADLYRGPLPSGVTHFTLGAPRLRPGLYLVRARTESGTYVRRVTILH